MPLARTRHLAMQDDIVTQSADAELAELEVLCAELLAAAGDVEAPQESALDRPQCTPQQQQEWRTGWRTGRRSVQCRRK